jgi:hypothetical protein
MRLTRKGWNNVIIFAAMAMILILNVSNDKLFADKEESSQQKLFPQGELILTLELNSAMIIERVGTGWKITPESRLNAQGLSAMMLAWQDSIGMTLASAPVGISEQGMFQAKLSLSGRPQPYFIDFYPVADQLLAYLHESEQWLTFPKASYGQLFPHTIIKDL